MTIELRQDVPLPEYVETDEQALDLLRFAMRKVEVDVGDLIGWDTETHAKHIPIPKAPPDPITDTVTFWSLCFATDESGERQYRRWCLQQQHFMTFAPLLEHPQACITAWNAKYDAHIAWNCNINVWNATIIDGLAMAQLHDENRREYSLKACARDWCGLHMTPYKALFDIDVHGNKAKEFETSLYDLDPGLVIDYASYDAYACLKTAEWIRDRLSTTLIHPNGRTLWDHFCEFEIPFTRTLWRMERRGLPVDVAYLREQIPRAEKEIDELEREVNRISGRPVNIKSPAQLSALFFNSQNPEQPKNPKSKPILAGFGLKPIKMTKGGSRLPQPSMDEEVLTLLGEMDGVPGNIAKSVLRCRKLHKVKSTYMESLVAMAEYFPDGRVHPNFHQFGARTGRLSTTNPNCVDGETEVLTSRGWVRFDELGAGSDGTVQGLVAQWDAESNKIEFTEAQFVKQDYEGEMIHVENKHIDLLMTPNHRCPLGNRQTSKMEVLTADNYKEDKIQLHGAPLDSASSIDLTNDQIAFILAVQADGHWHDGGIDFAVWKERKKDRLVDILAGMGAEFSSNINKNGKYRIRVLAGDAPKLAYKYLGETKLFGSWVLGLSQEQMSFFSREVFFWDGCWERKTMYASCKKTNADWVQAVLTLCGKRAKVRKYNTPEGHQDSWQVDCTSTNYSMTTNAKKSTIPWSGPVYCVTVPSGFFLIRRNGKACITGNSQNWPRPDNDKFGIRQSLVAPPGKKLIVSDWQQLEMRIMADRSQDPKMIQAIMDGKDLHSFTAGEMEDGISYEEVAAAKKVDEPDDRQRWLKSLRQGMKAVGFGIIYGAGPSKIAENITINEEDAWRVIETMDTDELETLVARKMKDNPVLSVAQAQRLVGEAEIAKGKIEAYFRVFPRVKAFMDGTPSNCKYHMTFDLLGNQQYRPGKSDPDIPYNWDVVPGDGVLSLTRTGHVKPFGFVQTYLGRYRRLEDIDHRQYQFRGHAEREATNVVIQGTAADLAKGAMLRVEGNKELNLMGVELLNQVHDELVLEAPEEHAEEALAIVEECMLHPFVEGEDPLCVPIPIDGKICDNWSEAK